MPIDSASIRARVENAANAMGRCWPLQSYIAANPLAGWEGQPFDEAVERAQRLFGGRGYPSAHQFRMAWQRGAIDPDVLSDELAAHGITAAPDDLLDRMEAAENDHEPAAEADDPLNRIMAKWLAAFLDQGQAAWPMPNREQGFYAAWRAIAPHDRQLVDRTVLADLPERRSDAVAQVLQEYPEARREAILTHHLAALPGWAAFIKWRAQESRHSWQEAFPITLVGYLAARLHTARALQQSIAPEPVAASTNGAATESHHTGAPAHPQLPAIWLTAWEATYRQQLLTDLDEASKTDPGSPSVRPDAQLVFCIDVRSEVIRRHLEATGEYETFGYAGFFGIPMQYQAYRADVRIDACPPIVDPKHRIADVPAPDRGANAEAHDWWAGLLQAGRSLVKTLKNNIAAAFGFVEAAGGVFGAAMAARTLMPHGMRRGAEALDERVPSPEEFCQLTMDRVPEADEPQGLPVGLTAQEKAFYAEAAFDLMGWPDRFAPVVVFTGHGSETVNNPYKSSLDCGACAGNPGGPNARALAALCNEPAVREVLRERGIDVPDDTVFIAGEHNTTTDGVRLIVEASLTDAQTRAVEHLRRDLETAQAGATAERARTLLGADPDSSRTDTECRAADWAETRPEWGLAGNAAFVVAPRALTAHLNLAGRSFLHSYDWRSDPNGDALEIIMTAPLIVGEWINTQYYFSTVDNAVYGSGSKVTHNVVGNFGIYQGNGGDLMTGLPLQSLYADDTTPYHHPLRLLAVIQAPVDRVEAIIRRNAELQQLFDNGWMALAVMDPEQENAVLHYEPGITWAPADRSTADRAAAEPSQALS